MYSGGCLSHIHPVLSHSHNEFYKYFDQRLIPLLTNITVSHFIVIVFVIILAPRKLPLDK